MARLFDNWLKQYAHHTRHSEAPDLFHFWTGVSTIAGALRRQVWIDQRYFQWTPNFYIILVGPAGVATKSTSIRIGFSILEQLEGVVFGPQSMTWQGLTQALEESRRDIPMSLEGDYLSMSCITCSVGELGTFLRPEDKELVDVLVHMWDGQQETWRRKLKTMSDTEIKNPWVNIIACTTPTWLRDNFTESMIGGGLTSRVVWVYGDKKRQYVAYPADMLPLKEFEDTEARLLEDLYRIAEMKGEYEITKEAKEWGTKWYKQLWEVRPRHMTSERFSGYIGRKQGHVHKLAMVVAASLRDELCITKSDLYLSNQMVTALERSMVHVFQSIGAGDVSSHVNEILAYVRAYDGITQKALWRHMMPIMSPREFEEATRAAIKAGYMKLMGQTYSPVKQEKSDE